MYRKFITMTLALALSAPSFARPPHGPDHFRGGPGHPPPHVEDGTRKPISPSMAEELLNQEEELLSLIEQKDAEAAKDLRQLKETNRELYLRKLHHIHKMRTIEAENPEAATLRRELHEKTRELHEVTRSYHESESDKEREGLEDEIHELATEIFELKQRDRTMKIEFMKQKIDELKAEIKERESDRDEIVEEFVQRLLTKHRDL